MPKPYVTLRAIWGNDDVEVDLKLQKKQWQEIVEGKKVEHSARYWYEGERYTSHWQFNAYGVGTVYIYYDGGGVGLDGRLEDVDVEFHSPSPK